MIAIGRWSLFGGVHSRLTTDLIKEISSIPEIADNKIGLTILEHSSTQYFYNTNSRLETGEAVLICMHTLTLESYKDENDIKSVSWSEVPHLALLLFFLL